jgi:hypothetical protein
MIFISTYCFSIGRFERSWLDFSTANTGSAGW